MTDPARLMYYMQLPRAYWATPERTLWTPCLAGLMARVLRCSPGWVTDEFLVCASQVVAGIEAVDPRELTSDQIWRGMAALADFGISVLKDWLPETLAPFEMDIGADASLAERLNQAERWVTETTRPLPWVALVLGTHLTIGQEGCDQFLRARPPFARLSKAFQASSLRQSLGTWQAAAAASYAFWSEGMGDLLLRTLIHADGRRAGDAKLWNAEQRKTAKVPPGPKQGRLMKLEGRLEAAKAEAAALAGQMAQLQREHAGLRLDVLEARQARDRAVARLRVIETSGAREGRGPGAEGRGSDGHGGQRGPNVVPAVREANPRRGEASPAASAANPPQRAERANAPAASAASSRQLAQRALGGRRVYLFTGHERAAARREMSRALEQYGAICEVYDGNRRGNLGPERFDPEALVVIETGHLSHSASDLIEERARASGAWFYVGPAGAGGLARKVAERWWRTRGERRAG